MRALFNTALIVSAVSAASSLLGRDQAAAGLQVVVGVPRARPPGRGLESLCPSHTLPDGRVCIPVPAGTVGFAPLHAKRGAHRERSGEWRVYDQIPRRPDRPSSYERYRLPLARPETATVVSGYDLHLPDTAQRRGATLSAVGHGGIDLVAERGAEVVLATLEHQVTDAEVLFVGPLFGNTVVTRHVLREGRHQRDYLVLFGHLERPAPGLRVGQPLTAGSLIGWVGDSGCPGVVHLHLEIRRVRAGVDPRALGSGELAHNARTVACDPRNVLTLLQPTGP